uniref:Protein spaetzle n=1 Tax=Timema douglasi TaxID=61478 RepID=A0A7R8VFK9_TIMDO|nr:unnamed protein product [Timema douglasi]
MDILITFLVICLGITTQVVADDATTLDGMELEEFLFEDNENDTRVTSQPLSDHFTSNDDQELQDYSPDESISNEEENNENIYKEQESSKKESVIYRAMLTAMKRPEMSHLIGQVLPIIRSMSPPQRLTLATLLTAQVMSSPNGVPPSLQQVVSMFGEHSGQGTEKRNILSELLLPISIDIANMFRGASTMRANSDPPEALKFRRHHLTPGPSLKKLILAHPGFTINMLGTSPTPFLHHGFTTSGHNRRNVQVETGSNRVQQLPGVLSQPARKQNPDEVMEHTKSPALKDCEYLTNTLCLEVTDYPKNAILSSIHHNQRAVEALLKEQEKHSTDRLLGNGTSTHEEQSILEDSIHKRRQDDGNNLQNIDQAGSRLCLSSVQYARPKRARATSGLWKYIVNIGDHTQTLRLEMCLRPQEPCSYILNNIRSNCYQVYNYHRLLTWDEEIGLHMDIFKVPTCCSCHVHGYSFDFPPLDVNEMKNQPEQFFGVEIDGDDHSRPFNIEQNKQAFRSPIPDDLVPPKGPPLPLAHEEEYQQFAGNQIRRSRNQTSNTFEEELDLDVDESSISKQPFPHVITSDTRNQPSGVVNHQITFYIVISSDVLDTATHVLSMASNIQQPCVILTHKLAELDFHQPGRSIGRTVLAHQQDASYMSYMPFSTGWKPNTLDFQGNVQVWINLLPE